MGLFLNLIELSARATDDALEYIYKAHSHDGDGDGIWKPHESKLIRRLIELFSQRGLDRLESVKKEIEAWTLGQRHAPSPTPVALPPGSMARWSDAERQLAKIYLESLPPAAWSLDDHMLAIDLVVQQYLPPDVLTGEAEWLAVRAGLMGKVQANMKAEPTAKQADAVLAAMPSTVAGAAQHFALQAAEKSALDFARVRCAENVRALSDSVRHKMRGVVLDHLEQAQSGTPAGGHSLQTKLLDTFGTLNRDWRRIAITEAGEAQLQGLIASLKPGTKVKRVEQYEGACGFCRKIDGVVATVVEPSKPNKNPDTEIWPGKNNIGRSASPRKRVGDVLVEREPHEMWHLPAGLAHPNCRGRWIVLEDTAQPGDDPAFADWLAANLK
jgi:hypothetical protein